MPSLAGFRHLTLDPSPRLRRIRERQEKITARRRRGVPLPPLPESAYAPGAVPLDMSGVP